MIKILFFAQVRELIGISSLEVESTYENIIALRDELAKKNIRWELALESNKLLTAVNHILVPMSHPLKSGDEVAFFPPVTGG
ncbi:molybdopterin synthase sulfur carrier subunit [Pantoea sp. Aalb]|uniref:molybdopterin synthase sulfur carrier subunit n=1 Tax=Pantoea sp. Aalb TaxID=2576762 RepID=UPI00132C04BD|nr:molybdopterin synthase sulfur carrier subunit [Pantoea sp. Aalb]MXP67520.1 molybdopterin synthase sulfur carrier subunit [Pantoea sp. Aalb]